MLKMGNKASHNFSNLPPANTHTWTWTWLCTLGSTLMSTCKANHWGWAVPWELEPAVVESAVSPESASLSSLLSASSRVSSKDRIEPSTREHDQSFGGLRRRWAEAASLLLCLGRWLSSCRRNHQLPLSRSSSLLCRCLPALSLLSGLPLHSLLSVNREGTAILCFCSLSYLFLESTGLLLKSCCSEIIDDVHHSPVCRIGRPSIFHGTAKHRSKVSECGTNAGIDRLTALPFRTGLSQLTRSLLLTSLRAYPNLPTEGLMMLLLCLSFLWSLLILE